MVFLETKAQILAALNHSPSFLTTPLKVFTLGLMGGTVQQVRPWSSYIWCALPVHRLSRKFSLISRDAWNKPPEERQFLQRLDSCLITYATLSYFSKYLDQHNIIVSVPCYAGSSKHV
jgi:hypothetical protein